jgi:hypothetical protein
MGETRLWVNRMHGLVYMDFGPRVKVVIGRTGTSVGKLRDSNMFKLRRTVFDNPGRDRAKKRNISNG